MKLFGEYLIEKGIVTEKALLSALIEQIKLSPSVCEIVFQDALIPPADLLRAITIQSKKQIGFMEACKELGLWTDEVMNLVKSKASAARTPVGQILIKQGAATFDVLTHALDEFLGDIESLPKVTNAASIVETPAVAAAPDRGVVNDYCEIFSSEKKQELDQFSVTAELNQESIQKFKESIHVIGGAARFIGAKCSEKLITEMEEILSIAMKVGVDKLSPDSKKGILETGRESAELAWVLRNILSESGSEAAFLADLEKQGLIKQIESKIGVLKFDLDML
jgi:hypothetical protein